MFFLEKKWDFGQITIFRNYWGWIIDVLNSTSHSLNFTYTIKNPTILKFGYNKDGSYRGNIGQAKDKISDISAQWNKSENSGQVLIVLGL